MIGRLRIRACARRERNRGGAVKEKKERATRRGGGLTEAGQIGAGGVGRRAQERRCQVHPPEAVVEELTGRLGARSQLDAGSGGAR